MQIRWDYSDMRLDEMILYIGMDIMNENKDQPNFNLLQQQTNLDYKQTDITIKIAN